MNSLQKKAEESRFKELWYKRNPVHETNADSGEDMFWQTAILVAKEFAEPLAGQQKTGGWISVEDGLPKLNELGESEWVLIFCVAIGPIRAYYSGECWCDVDNEYRGAITHWMPLPSPPTGEPGEDQEGGEKWIEIPESNGEYLVSGCGKFMSLKTNKTLRPSLGGGKNQYLFVNLQIDGNPKKYYSHITVARLFVDNSGNKPEVNHKDGNSFNNWWWNLEWVTHQENCIHAIETNLMKAGRKTEVFKGGVLVKECKSLSDAARFIGTTIGNAWLITNVGNRTHKGYSLKQHETHHSP